MSSSDKHPTHSHAQYSHRMITDVSEMRLPGLLICLEPYLQYVLPDSAAPTSKCYHKILAYFWDHRLMRERLLIHVCFLFSASCV